MHIRRTCEKMIKRNGSTINLFLAILVMAAIFVLIIVAIFTSCSQYTSGKRFDDALEESIRLSSGVTLSSADVTLSFADVKLSSADVTLYSADVTLSFADVTLSSADVTLSFADVKLSFASKDEILKLRIQYMKELSEMHKNSSTNNIFTFIFVFLSTVLIGLCHFLLKTSDEKVGEVEKKASTIEKDMNRKKEEFDSKAGEAVKIFVDLEEKLNTLAKSFDEKVEKLEKGFDKLSADVNKVEKQVTNQITNQKTYSLFNFASQLLFEAHITIANYSRDPSPELSKICTPDPNNENLVMFNDSLYQIDDRCKKINFGEVDKPFKIDFLKRLNYVEGLYERAAQRDNDEKVKGGINEDHKKITYERFNSIKKQVKAATQQESYNNEN